MKPRAKARRCRTCCDRVSVLQTLLFDAHPQLDFETSGEALLGFPQRLQHQGLLVVSHHPKTLPLPLVVSVHLADNIAEHVIVGVLFFQAVPEGEK